MSIENSLGITYIKTSCEVQTQYPIDETFYTNYIDIEIALKSKMLDYEEFKEFVKGLSGKQMVIEDVVYNVFNYLTELAPRHLIVTSNVNINGVPISVTKEG